MKKILSLSLVFVLVLSAFVLAACKGTNDKDAQNCPAAFGCFRNRRADGAPPKTRIIVRWASVRKGHV